VHLNYVHLSDALISDPSAVWEFYHYRRELMRSKQPNPAHLAIAACQQRWQQQNRLAAQNQCLGSGGEVFSK
jgi:NAD-dependent SIR2 family protein deacetylase